MTRPLSARLLYEFVRRDGAARSGRPYLSQIWQRPHQMGWLESRALSLALCVDRYLPFLPVILFKRRWKCAYMAHCSKSVHECMQCMCRDGCHRHHKVLAVPNCHLLAWHVKLLSLPMLCPLKTTSWNPVPCRPVCLIPAVTTLPYTGRINTDRWLWLPGVCHCGAAAMKE